jgi:hypothetical protein
LKSIMGTLDHLQRRRACALRFAARAAVGGYVAFAALNAQAADVAAIAPAFGNTIVSKYPDGTSQKIWLHADGSWDGVSRKGKHLAGHWALHANEVCLRQSSPPTLPIRYCTAVPASGDAQWSGKDVLGRPITLSLMKGVPSEYQAGGAATR